MCCSTADIRSVPNLTCDAAAATAALIRLGLEYHDEVIDELAEHLKICVAVREAETTKLQ